MVSSPKLRAAVVHSIVLSGTALCLLVAAAQWHWSGELAASFRWQLAGVGLCGLLLLLVLRARRAAAVVAAFTGWLAWPAASLWLPRTGTAPPGISLRVATVNAFMDNRNGPALTTWLREADPDVAAIQEVDLFWLQQLRGLEDRWPHRVTFPAREEDFHKLTFGMVLLAKGPVRLVETFDHLGRSGGIVAEVVHMDRIVHFIAAHPERPGRSQRVVRRNQVLRQIAERARVPRPMIVLGDLNTSSGSPAFRQRLRDSDLLDSRRGFGRQPTWRTWSPIRGLEVDIDHVLHSPDLWVLDRRVGGSTGSDHSPVLVDFILARPDTN